MGKVRRVMQMAAITCGVSVLVVIGWLISTAFPVCQEKEDAAVVPNSILSSGETRAGLGCLVDIPFGSSRILDGVGYSKLFGEGRALSLSGPFEMRILDAKVVGEAAFADLCPDYDIRVCSNAAENEGSIIIVATEVTNLSDSSYVKVPIFSLWSKPCMQVSDVLDSGTYPSIAAAKALDSFPGEQYKGAGRNISDYVWDVVEPGAVKSIYFTFYLPQGVTVSHSSLNDSDLPGYYLIAENASSSITYCFCLGRR